MSYLTEAFKALDALNEETFSVSDDGIKKLAEFETDDDLFDEITVFDADADDTEDLEDSYVGKVIIDCNVCHSKIYKDKSDVVIDEETQNANIDEECPYCYSTDGFKVIGEVAPMTTETEEKVEVEDDLDESLNEDIDSSELDKLTNYIKTSFKGTGIDFKNIQNTKGKSFVVIPESGNEYTSTEADEIDAYLDTIIEGYYTDISLTEDSEMIIEFIADEENESLKESVDSSEINKLSDYIKTSFKGTGIPFKTIKHEKGKTFSVTPKENRDYKFSDLDEIESYLETIINGYDTEISLSDHEDMLITFITEKYDNDNIPLRKGLGYLEKYVEPTNSKPQGIDYNVGDVVNGYEIVSYLQPKKGYRYKDKYPLVLTRNEKGNEYVEKIITDINKPELALFGVVDLTDFEIINESKSITEDVEVNYEIEKLNESSWAEITRAWTEATENKLNVIRDAGLFNKLHDEVNNLEGITGFYTDCYSTVSPAYSDITEAQLKDSRMKMFALIREYYRKAQESNDDAYNWIEDNKEPKEYSKYKVAEESLTESINSDIVSMIKKQFPKATIKTSVRKHSDVHKSNPDTPVGKTKYVDIRITPDEASSVNAILQYCNHNIKKVLDSDNRFDYYGDVPARNPRGGKEVILSYEDYSDLSDDEYNSLMSESIKEGLFGKKKNNKSSKNEATEMNEDKTYIDAHGGFGEPGAKITFTEIKKYWDDNSDTDPILQDYDSFEDWFKETKQNYLTEIDESLNEAVDLLTREDTIASVLSRHMDELSEYTDATSMRNAIINILDKSEIADKDAVKKLKQVLFSKKSTAALLSTIATYMTGEKVAKVGKPIKEDITEKTIDELEDFINETKRRFPGSEAIYDGDTNTIKITLDKKTINEDLGTDIDEYQQWVDYDMKRYGKISDQTNKEIKEAGLQVVKDKYGDYQVIAGKYDESLKESVKDVTITTDDSKTTMISEDDGKVTVTTEPVEKHQDDEVIEPLTDETEAEIVANDGEEDIDIEDFDEESFDELGEGYFKKVYENVNSFKTSNVSTKDNKVIVEGIVTFDNNIKKSTKFIFESFSKKNDKYRMIGENVNITKGNKAFSLMGSIKDKKFLSESLNYNYRTKNNIGKSTRCLGTVRRG